MNQDPRISGLYGLVDASASPGRSHEEIGRALLQASVRVLQVRWKNGTDAQIRALLRILHPLCEEASALLIVNDHMRIAADFAGVGLHLGQDDADPRAARRILGPSRIIGWSTHSEADIVRAHELPLDYLGFGPVFDGMGKHRTQGDRRKERRPVGVEALRAAVTRASPLPVVAIGGITKANFERVRATGVAAWAVLGAVSGAPDISAAVPPFQGG